jgi:proline dehydrogenase
MNMNAYFEKIFAGRWIAGYYLIDAINVTKQFNSRKISTMINFLGEDVYDKEKIMTAVRTYIDAIREMKNNKLNASISLKPTQIGLKINYKEMASNYMKIVKHAKKSGVFVWLDMEGPENVDATIKAYKTAIRYKNTGICIQSYLRRSENDVNKLLEHGAIIRLVKGAYKRKTEITFKSKREINANYIQIMRLLFSKAKKFMIATHDSRIIDEAIKINKRKRRDVTFAMLNGIRNKYAVYLTRSGQKVSKYVPFGGDWIGYSLRRLTEEGHIMLIIRSLFEKQSL